MKKAIAGPLKPICIAGLILALIVSWGLILFALFWNRDISAAGKASANTFAGELKAYDLFDAPKRALEGESPEEIEKRLSRLQTQARGIEQQLSVLKRRRALALADRRYTAGYAKAAREAAEAYAFSAPLAAAAAEALVLEGAVNERSLLKNYASRISQDRFDLLELSLHVLAGNLDDPAAAASVPGLQRLLSLVSFPAAVENGRAFPERRNILIDEFLLLAYKDDIPGAAVKLSSLLESARPVDSGLLRMAAEFFYDHENPLRAAELFSRLDGETDIARAADALVLAGEVMAARNVWLALSSPELSQAIFPAAAGDSGRLRSRSFYNLAAASADPQEEISWLEKIFPLQSQSRRAESPREEPQDSLGLYSIIRYARLLDTEQSKAVLGDGRQHPLVDLEYVRRGLETLPPNRATAEVWLLLGRHDRDEALHEWAAWYFDHQRLYSETGRLLKEAARKGMSGSWIDLHNSLTLLREGRIAEGEKILKDAERRSRDWRIPANLARIQESRGAISAALESYEAAAALIADRGAKENSSAALIQLRLSRCLEALNRPRDSRRALEYAFELDPDNINIRREYRRLSPQ